MHLNPNPSTTSTDKGRAPESDLSTSSTVPEQTKEDHFCAVCGGQYKEETDYVEKWIACDKCDSWSHWTCVGISEEPEEVFCSSSVNN